MWPRSGAGVRWCERAIEKQVMQGREEWWAIEESNL